MKIRNPPFDKLVDTNCGPTIVESQRDVSGFLPTAGEETAFFSEHPVPPCSHQTNCGEIVQLVINHLKYILFELYCSCLRVYAFSLYLLKPFCTVEPALCKHVPLGDTMQCKSQAAGFQRKRFRFHENQPCRVHTTPGNRRQPPSCVLFQQTVGTNCIQNRAKILHFFWNMHMYSKFRNLNYRERLFSFQF